MPALLRNDPKIVWPDGKVPGWTHNHNGMGGGKFGRVDHVVIVDDKSNALYDKCIVHEGGHVITITYGQNAKDEWVLGLVKEARDTAAPTDGVTTLAFWGPPRGYRGLNESAVAAAMREAGEEAGASVILNTLEVGNMIVNEAIVSSWSPIVALEVDLSRLSEIAPEHGEKIYKAKFFTLEQIDEMIIRGAYDDASTRSMVLMSMLTLFRLCVLPTHYPNPD